MSTPSSEHKSFSDLERWLNERRITEIECLVPDLTGVARGKILPREKFSVERGMRMPEAVLGMTVTGEQPSSEVYNNIIAQVDHDMFLRPDPSTVCVVPWASDPTAQVIHDCYFRDGHYVDFAPRSVLRRVLKCYDKMGWRPVVAPELEFYLIARNPDPVQPLRPPVGRSGRPETSRQVYSIDAVNEFDTLFEDIYDYCAAQELDIDTLIHEIGAGQMEINFLHGDPLALADRVFYFKRSMREAAIRHDMYATFMAKPIEGEPGSAMHIHQSVVDAVTGLNIFSKPDGSPSDHFQHFIGGLQKYLPKVLILVAPYVNSYRRLTRHSTAPINLQWGFDNRTVGLRLPHADADSRRIENRVIGADANPYVALATTLACGYLGMIEEIKPTVEQRGSAYESDFELPASLDDALRAIKEDRAVSEVLGERFIEIYAQVKEAELQEFMKVISPWEREHLLLHV